MGPKSVLLVLDRQWIVRGFAGAVEQGLGRPPSEVLGRHLGEVVPPTTLALLQDELTHRAQGVSSVRAIEVGGGVAVLQTDAVVTGKGPLLLLVLDEAWGSTPAGSAPGDLQAAQLEAITNALTAFLQDKDGHQRASGILLRAALDQTESEYGFAGVLVEQEPKAPVLRILAHEGVRWDLAVSSALFETASQTYREKGYIEFRDFRNLFGTALTTGRPVLANAPSTDSRRGTLPLGHPPLAAFLGVPVLRGREVVGIVGVANRPGGYGDDDLGRIELLTGTASVLFDSYRRSLREAALQTRANQSDRLQAVGRVAGGVAHDFNNLLTAISGYSELLLDRLPARDPIRSEIEEIRKAGARAAALVRQLLAFSRRQVLQPKVVDLNATIGDMTSMLRRLIGTNVVLATALAPDLGRVLADPSQLEQVVMNLVVNARDAVGAGGTITIETANGDLAEVILRKGISGEGGPCVRLSVVDDGCGMDEETLTHLFEPFFTTKDVGRGTGLGLASVYGIVRQSGGQICVESAPGRGTRFDLYFPRTAAAPEPSTPAQAHSRSSPPGQGILVVKDDECVRSLVSLVLGRAGHHVVLAANGAEALQIVEEQSEHLALVLTDVVMPEMSGHALVDRIRARHPATKVLFMSGYTESGIVKQGILLEATDFIQKPFTPAALLRKIQEVLAKP